MKQTVLNEMGEKDRMNSTKGRIASGFKKLVCKKSFQKITISDIAKECNMTRENFYYHFRDKYDIIRWIFDKEFVEKYPKDGDLEAWLLSIMYTVEKDHIYYKRLIREVGTDIVRENFYPIMEEKIHRYVEESVSDAVWSWRKERIDFSSTFFANALIELVIYSIMKSEAINKELFQQNLAFLFATYLPFLRNEKENIPMVE